MRQHSEMARKQWSVGQGGFHSAVYSAAGKMARYVYDCGSQERSALDYAVGQYRDSLREGEGLDLVVLSHIDEDHVNGLDLLTDRLPVGMVLLPLLSNVEKLIALARTSPGVPQRVVGLIADPRSAITDMTGDASLIEITPGGERAASGDEASVFADANDESPVTLIGPAEDSRSATTSGSVSDACAVLVGPRSTDAWLLSFFVVPHIRAKAEEFLVAAANMLRVSVEELSRMAPEELADEVRKPGVLDRLREAYRKAKVRPNPSSLIMLSRPFTDDSRFECVELGSRIVSAHQPPSWLHTGDAELNATAVRHLRSHFGDEALASVGTLTLPHHGSASNFHSDLLVAVPCTRLAVAMAGPYADSQKWSHPGASVIRQTSSASVLPWVVSDALGSSLYGWVSA